MAFGGEPTIVLLQERHEGEKPKWRGEEGRRGQLFVLAVRLDLPQGSKIARCCPLNVFATCWDLVFLLFYFAVTPLDLDGACIWRQRKLRKKRKRRPSFERANPVRYTQCAGSLREISIAIVWDGMFSLPFCAFCFEHTHARFRVGVVVG